MIALYFVLILNITFTYSLLCNNVEYSINMDILNLIKDNCDVDTCISNVETKILNNNIIQICCLNEYPTPSPTPMTTTDIELTRQEIIQCRSLLQTIIKFKNKCDRTNFKTEIQKQNCLKKVDNKINKFNEMFCFIVFNVPF